jgi:hypothetical protein
LQVACNRVLPSDLVLTPRSSMPDAAPARTPGFFGTPPLLETSSTTKSTQKVRGSSHPIAAFRHEFPDANGHRIRLDDAFECGFAVRIVGARKGARDHSAVPRAIAHKLVRRSFSLEAYRPQQTLRPHVEGAPRMAIVFIPVAQNKSPAFASAPSASSAAVTDTSQPSMFPSIPSNRVDRCRRTRRRRSLC